MMTMKRQFWMMALIGMSLLFVQCGEFQDVFNRGGQTSYKASKKKPRFSKNDKSSNDQSVESMRAPIVTDKGTYYFVQPGDTLIDISKRYKMSRQHMAQINNLYDSKLVIGRRLFIPSKKTRSEFMSVTEVIKADKIKRDRMTKKIKFIWPVQDFVLTSPYAWRRGRMHDGIDLSAKRGTPMNAAADGEVLFAERFAGYGNLIVIKHSRNYFTAYAHADTVKVKEGQKVKAGQQIGTVGNTGRSTGPHLHFEVHQQTQSIDPMKVLPKDMPGKVWKR